MSGLSAEYILRAAIKSLEQGRAPHCFRAHVPGEGYVNNGSKVYDQADYTRQAVRAAQAELDNLGYASGYAEPGYTDPAKGVLFANWNRLPKGVDSLLERAGYEIEWSDEWTTCEDCMRAFRTSPDSYCWKPAGRYVEEEHSELCNQCIGELPKDEEEEEIEEEEG